MNANAPVVVSEIEAPQAEADFSTKLLSDLELDQIGGGDGSGTPDWG
jgi:hypothetical protein